MFTGLSPIEIGFLLIAIIVSMSIHEAMHGFTAHWLGDPTAQESGRLTLNPLKHIDLITTVLLPLLLILSGLPPFFAAKPVPFNPMRVRFDEYGTALIGVAGPLTNLALAIISGFFIKVAGADMSSTIYNAFLIFTEVNVAFFVFNMIPFPPLDGSRLLYAFAPEPLQEIMMRIEQMGFFAILVFILIGFQFIAPFILSIQNFILRLVAG